MVVTGATADVRRMCDAARAAGRVVGFVPTMGSLHQGHLSLVRRARAEADLVVMSIFVNPLQFGPSEDLASYPRDPARDLRLAEAEAVDAVFAPDEQEMYPGGRPEVTVDPGPLAERLEGAARPGHFRGVCTIVAKLFGIVGACRAYFGEKDAQQLAVVRRMVADLDLPVEVIGCPVVREPDGLAMSSRNVHLSADERRSATCLSEALAAAAELVADGERDTGVLRAAMEKRIMLEPLAALDYTAVVDDGAFEELERIDGPSRALVAARFGRTRLIDNLPLRVEDGGAGP